MSITALTRTTYLLVFRDVSHRRQEPVPRAKMGSLLQQWLEWHDRLEAQGRLRFRCPAEPESRSVAGYLGTPAGCSWGEQGEPVIGCLLADATSLDEATEVARECPGLAHGFMVEIYPLFARGTKGDLGSQSL